MPINISGELTASLQQHFSFAWCTQSFLYLGIQQLTPTCQTLFHSNYHPIFPRSSAYGNWKDIPWLLFEMYSISLYHLSGLLWSKSIQASLISPLNRIIAQTLHLWSLYKKKFNLVSPVAPLSTFVGDPNFSPSLSKQRPYGPHLG